VAGAPRECLPGAPASFPLKLRRLSCAIVAVHRRYLDSALKEEPVANDGVAVRRGRPRDNAVDERVLDVAWDLLLTGGSARISTTPS